MQIKRAKQIMESDTNIPVYYRNTPVHINKVNVKEDLVYVTNLNNHKDMILNCKTISECNKTN